MDVLELPCLVHLDNGTGGTIALATPGDGAGILEFYRSMSEEDRMFLREDVTTSDWLERFLGKLASGEAISVLGRVGGELRGEATLYRSLHGWSRHVGEIRLNVDRGTRGQGLGLLLVRHIVRLAIDAGIDKLVAQMVESQVSAIRTFTKLGFHKEAELRNHVTDIHGRRRNLLLYADDVSHVWAAMESLLRDFRPDRAIR